MGYYGPRRNKTTERGSVMKKTKNKLSDKQLKKDQDNFQNALKKKINSQFGGLKVKDLGDGMTEISFK